MSKYSFTVVPDSMRRQRNHRGRATPQVVQDLLDGKTVRGKSKPSGSALIDEAGKKITSYRDKETGDVISWLVPKTTKP